MKSKNKKSTKRHTAQKSQTRQPATNSAQLSPDQLKAGGTSMLSQTISAAQAACATEAPPSSDAASPHGTHRKRRTTAGTEARGIGF